MLAMLFDSNLANVLTEKSRLGLGLIDVCLYVGTALAQLKPYYYLLVSQV
jgi:hypothetical protein